MPEPRGDGINYLSRDLSSCARQRKPPELRINTSISSRRPSALQPTWSGHSASITKPIPRVARGCPSTHSTSALPLVRATAPICNMAIPTMTRRRSNSANGFSSWGRRSLALHGLHLVEAGSGSETPARRLRRLQGAPPTGIRPHKGRRYTGNRLQGRDRTFAHLEQTALHHRNHFDMDRGRDRSAQLGDVSQLRMTALANGSMPCCFGPRVAERNLRRPCIQYQVQIVKRRDLRIIG